VGPEILPKDAPNLLDVIDQPRQREPERIGVVQSVHRDRFGFAKRLVNALRDPWVFTVYVFAHDNRVHDREDFRASVPISLGLLVVWEQACDPRRTVEEEFWDVERHQGIELARFEHRLERLPA